MALEAVDKVVNDDKLLTLFNINENLWEAVRFSWNF
jgi:glutathionylspermidine synthase